MYALEFNNENVIKVAREMAKGLIRESAANLLRSKIKGEDIDMALYGMAKAAGVLTGILTNADAFYDAINFLAKEGVTIE